MWHRQIFPEKEGKFDGIPPSRRCLGYNLTCNNLGRLAQLVERLPYTQNVGSSSLSAPTKISNFRFLGLLVHLDPNA